MSEPVVLSQEKLEDHLKDLLENWMENIAPILVKEIILEMRWMLTAETCQEKAYIEFRDVPSKDDLFDYLIDSCDMRKRQDAEFLAFTEKKGILVIQERIREWEEEAGMSVAEYKASLKNTEKEAEP